MKHKPSKKSKIPGILLVVTLFAGLSLLLYPFASDWWNSMHQSHAIAAYVDVVTELDDGAYEQLLQQARDYNASLVGQPDRFLPDEQQQQRYDQLLNVSGDGIIGYVEIPSIHVSLPIYHGTDEEVLQVAVGHIVGSSLPVGGEGTHCVISGHRGLPSARLFTDIDQLEKGDRFYIHVLDEVLAYEVDQILDMVDKDDMDTLSSAMAITEGEDHVTLFTCTPYGVNTHRLLVRGVRVPYNGEEEVTVTPAESMVRAVQDYYMLYLILGLSVTLLIILILRCLIRPKKQRNSDGQADSGKK